MKQDSQTIREHTVSPFEEEALKEYAVWFEDPNRANALPKPVRGHEWFMVKIASEIPSAISLKLFLVAGTVQDVCFPAVMMSGQSDWMLMFPPRDAPSWEHNRAVQSLWRAAWADANRTVPNADMIRGRLQPCLGTEMIRDGNRGWLVIASQ